jgi:pre-rRNA-processing protein TSR1
LLDKRRGLLPPTLVALIATNEVADLQAAYADLLAVSEDTGNGVYRFEQQRF